jgi:hypothetical protein
MERDYYDHVDMTLWLFVLYTPGNPAPRAWDHVLLYLVAHPDDLETLLTRCCDGQGEVEIHEWFQEAVRWTRRDALSEHRDHYGWNPSERAIVARVFPAFLEFILEHAADWIERVLDYYRVDRGSP